MEWISMSTPPEKEEECLVIMKGSNEIEALNWNNHYRVWDDYKNNDFYCKAEEASYWIPFSNLPNIPEE